MELISREEVINIIHRKIQNTSDYLQHDALIDVEFKVDELPTVEAKEVVHGEWILKERAGIDYWCCSQCHKIESEYYAKPKDNFCPNCGADMRKKV